MPGADCTAEHCPEHATDAGEVLEVLDTLDERYLEEWGQRMHATARALIAAIEDLEQYGGLEGALAILEAAERAGQQDYKPGD